MQVANLAADLTANTARFESGFKRANHVVNTSTSSWARSLGHADSKFGAVGSTIGLVTGKFNGLYSAIVAIASGGILGGLTRSSLQAADAIKDTADRLQISTDKLQAYQYAALQSGLETGTLETALTKLQAKIADGEVDYDNTAEGFEAIAEAVRNAKDDIDRARIVNENFGDKLGAKLIPILTDGRAGLAAFGDEAQRTGNIMSEDLVKSAAAFNDKMEALSATINNNFKSGFLRSLVDDSGDLRDIYTDPEFSKGIQNIGIFWGAVAAAIANGVLNLREFAVEQRKLRALDDGFDDPKAGYDYMLGRMSGTGGGFDSSKAAGIKGALVGKLQPGESAPVVPASKPQTPVVPYSVPGASKAAAKAGASEADKYRQVLESLRAQRDELQQQTSLYGQKESAIDRAVAQVRIENQLRAQGIKITQAQKAELGQYLDQIEVQNEMQAVQAEQTKKLEEAERSRQAALKQFGGDIVDSLQEAIDAGGDLSDVVKKLALDILKLAMSSQQFKQVTDSAAGGISGIFGSVFKGLLGGVFGGMSGSTSQSVTLGPSQVFPSHASGIDLVARDSFAKIHQGEAVLNRQDAALWRGGSKGDGGINVGTIDARGAGPGVGAEIRNIINEMNALRRAVPAMAVGAIAEANRRNPRLLNV